MTRAYLQTWIQSDFGSSVTSAFLWKRRFDAGSRRRKKPSKASLQIRPSTHGAGTGNSRSGAGGRQRSIRGLLWVGLLLLASGAGSPAHAGVPNINIDPCPISLQQPCLVPSQIIAAYGVAPLLKAGIRGQGRSIAIIDSFGSTTLRSDLNAFDRAFGLPDPGLTVLAPLGTADGTGSGWDNETALDVEWAHVIAPDARIVVLESPVNETEGVQGLPQFLALERYVLQHHLADVISQSWSATEHTLSTAAGRALVIQFHQFYQEAAAQGITVVGSSGDTGAAGLDSSLKRFFPEPATAYPASDPLVLSVGATALSPTSGNQGLQEVAWAGSGGGFSSLFAEPEYQRTLSATLQKMLSGKRGVPDVAYNGAKSSAVPTIVHGKWRLAWGTSAGAPQWAALIALADSAAGHDLSSVNAALYRIAGSPRYSADFRDSTEGASVGPSRDGTALTGSGFRATRGWDPVTGLGTPHAAALIHDLIQLKSSTSSR